MPTLSELGRILIACRAVSVDRWRRAAEAGRGDPARTLDALAASPPEWWSAAEGDGEPPPGLTDYQRGVIELWFDGDEADLPRQLARNQFLLLEKLGQGGQGEVYRARQLNPGRFVAVKALREESERRRQRFEQEARAMMKVQHPGVARFHLYERVRDAAGQPTDEYLIAMEFVEGNDLSRLIDALGPLPWPFVARWAVNVLEGLAVIHQSGFIHRDVKPANVMVQGPLPERGVSPSRTAAKLLDFGAVKPADEGGGVGRRRVFVGTREYAAPEQWEEQAVPASDVYALGATLFHALTGRPPYEVEGRDAVAFMKAHARAPVPDAADFVPALPDEVSALLHRMLAKDPEDRGTAAALARSFRDLLPTLERSAFAQPAKKVATPRPTPKPAPRRAEPEPEPKSPLHAVLHFPLSLLEAVFLPRRLRPPAGHEPPLPERLAALARRPLLLLTLLLLIILVVWCAL
jgi:serine/threonine protein kinase